MLTRYLLAPVVVVSLSACAMSGQPVSDTQQPGNLQHDMASSRQVQAFKRMDAQLGYQNARIQYGQNNCLLYEGVDNGQTKVVPLTDDSGQQICIN